VPALADDLKRVPLFSGLNERQLKRLSRDFQEREFEPGTTPVRQGHMSGIGFFVISEGEATISVDGAEVARLGQGDYFGELGLISERPRTATVTAETPLKCLELASWDFRRFIDENPDASWTLLQHLVDLVASAEERARRGAPSAATTAGEAAAPSAAVTDSP
jgi:CRP-like cAMP-binding protein